MDADRQDIQATLDGDGDAFARIVERHQAWVARRMWRFTRDRRQLEELTADVFVEVFRSLSGFRGTGSFEAWVGRIATRTGYRFWRKRDRRRQVLPLDNRDAAEGNRELAAAEAAELIHHLLERLPPRDRLVLTLLYLEDLSVAEAARQAGWSETMTKVQAHRARKKLRKLLEDQQIDRSVTMDWSK